MSKEYIENSSCDLPIYYRDFENARTHQLITRYEHQIEAIKQCTNKPKDRDRGQLVIVCGTRKKTLHFG